MCYVVYFSTTSTVNFEEEGNGLFIVEPVPHDDEEDILNVLQYPNRWYLSSRYSGCSCHYRHWCKENGDWFNTPQDWMEEDPEDIESTGAFYDLISRIVSEREQIDLVDAWAGTSREEIRSLEVLLSEVPREAFRFFENARFEFLP